ncbi:MAG: carbohydrate kinase family protein [Candidatus Aureabacteria bacterium]|nr:carbohydrate kinase family protein [Candidatus Auribacterota bacterium]
MFDVVGIGRSCIDHIAIVKGLPRVDTKTPVLRYAMAGGGQSSTAMVALARLGLKTAYVGVVGDDALGEMVVAGLKREGVDTSGVKVIKGVPTPVALILVEEKKGTRTIAYLDSMKGRLTRKTADLDVIFSARVLMIDPYGTRLGVEIGKEVKKRGIVTVYDAEHETEGFSRMLALADYLVASRDVAETLGLKTPRQALTRLFSYKPKAAVVTLGKEGCIALSSGGFMRTPAFQVEVVDSTAAGDAFHAGFAYGVFQEWPLDKTLAFANALGALVCRGLGGRETLPTLGEALSFIRRSRRAFHHEKKKKSD